MRIVGMFVVAVLAACSGPQKKPEGAVVETGSDTPETCCCKWTPQVSEDGRPQFEGNSNRMECSSRQGECVDEVQCAGKPQAEPTPKASDDPQPEPESDESAPAVEKP